MNDSNNFQFKPRQEAHPMKWDELMRPVRRALADLLIRIDGAERAVNEVENNTDKKEVANCFLVHGIRGTGKTTVLLSAREAVCSKSDFIPSKKENNASEDKPEENAARESIKYLKEKNIVWLPILDLESLPANSNLLTYVLTQMLNALEPSDYGKKAPPTSIFEESAESPRLKFKELIREATTIWEKIQEADTRTKANRQVAAAEMYANFRERFQKAMQALSEQLGRKHGRDSKACSVVLSIDNIDRNTDHLYSIVKFAQLISHNRLWLILAGEENDIETFLERGHWNELIYNKDGRNVPFKENWEGEDETLVMARRQAAAAYQKLLPPSHRIEIDRVQPYETLSFKPSDSNEDIHNLFSQIKILLKESEEDNSKEICFTDLLDVRRFFEPSVSKPPPKTSQEDPTEDQHSIRIKILPKSNDEYWVSLAEITDSSKAEEDEFKYLTHFAWHALHLPARTVLDLWQLAHYVVYDNINAKGKKFQAERIARKMLSPYLTPIP